MEIIDEFNGLVKEIAEHSPDLIQKTNRLLHLFIAVDAALDAAIDIHPDLASLRECAIQYGV